MNPTHRLQELGQSLWLDNITRRLLDEGTLQRYIDDLAVTGLTSNPTIFHAAVQGSDAYDGAIADAVGRGEEGEDLFFGLAIDDLTRAADLFRAVHTRSDGEDGWVSLEVSPLLAYDAERTAAEAVRLHAWADRPNLFIKIPGTAEGLPAVEEAIFRGVPVNVTLLFSTDHYLAALDAYARGIERRIEAGLAPRVRCVASLFVSRWDRAVTGKVPPHLHNRLGVAVSLDAYRASRRELNGPRWQRLLAAGAVPQRLLWASTGTKDPQASDVLYVEALAAPETINTMPEETLLAFADHGAVGAPLPEDGAEADRLLAEFADAGVDVAALAATLQKEGAEAFVKSWNGLMSVLAARCEEVRRAG